MGQIYCIEVAGDGTCSAAKPAIQLPIHLSYPYLFEHEETLNCIRDDASKEIALYRCEEFPQRWVKVRSLLSGVSLVDSCLVRYQGRWWLFSGDKDETIAP